MKLIGRVDDVIAFGLAGVDGLVCDTGDAVTAALAQVRRDPDVAVVLLSARAAAAAPENVAAAVAAPGFPLIVVLPAPAPAAGETTTGDMP